MNYDDQVFALDLVLGRLHNDYVQAQRRQNRLVNSYYGPDLPWFHRQYDPRRDSDRRYPLRKAIASTQKASDEYNDLAKAMHRPLVQRDRNSYADRYNRILDERVGMYFDNSFPFF